MAFVFVEGPDCTGKTTFCTELARVLEENTGREVVVRHHQRPRHRAVQEYVEPYLDYRPTSGPHYVLDRAHVGEAVWPWVFGRPALMSPAERECVELFFDSRGAVGVLAVRPDLADLKRAHAASGQPYPTSRVPKVVQEFAVQMSLVHSPWVQYEHGDPVENVAGLTLARADEVRLPRNRGRSE